MDINIIKSDIIEKNEDMMIHFFFNLFKFDFRDGLFTDESSIYDMFSTGLEDQDYIDVANEYYQKTSNEFTYTQCEKLYYKILNKKFNNMIFKKFNNTYGFNLDPKIHLLTDIINLLNKKFPERNWKKDNIFIIKTLDNIKIENTKTELKEKQEIQKVVKLPVKKKLTDDEVRASTNEFLMIKQLGMNFEEAKKLAEENYNKKMQNKKFEPYIPNKPNKKIKL
jgi:hypothetical protein